MGCEGSKMKLNGGSADFMILSLFLFEIFKKVTLLFYHFKLTIHNTAIAVLNGRFYL